MRLSAGKYIKAVKYLVGKKLFSKKNLKDIKSRKLPEITLRKCMFLGRSGIFPLGRPFTLI